MLCLFTYNFARLTRLRSGAICFCPIGLWICFSFTRPFSVFCLVELLAKGKRSVAIRNQILSVSKSNAQETPRASRLSHIYTIYM